MTTPIAPICHMLETTFETPIPEVRRPLVEQMVAGQLVAKGCHPDTVEGRWRSGVADGVSIWVYYAEGWELEPKPTAP